MRYSLSHQTEPCSGFQERELNAVGILIARIIYWLNFGCRSISHNRQTFSQGVAKLKILLATASSEACEARHPIKSRPGLTPAMLDWSVYMTLKHTDQVHVEILELIELLEQDVQPELGDISRFDTIGLVGPEVVQHFFEHAKQVENLPDHLSLTGINKVRHPIFGSLTSRGYYAVLAMHIWRHIRQIEACLSLHTTNS
jgi:hypothetical protein